MSIYVGNLSYQVTEEDLKRAFAEYGTVSRVQLPTDRETGRPRGFAFVEMPVSSEAREAIATLNNLGIGKKVLVVKEATESPASRMPSQNSRTPNSTYRPYRPGSGRPSGRY